MKITEKTIISLAIALVIAIGGVGIPTQAASSLNNPIANVIDPPGE
jgi:hypothetical protein